MMPSSEELQIFLQTPRPLEEDSTTDVRIINLMKKLLQLERQTTFLQLRYGLENIDTAMFINLNFKSVKQGKQLIETVLNSSFKNAFKNLCALGPRLEASVGKICV